MAMLDRYRKAGGFNQLLNLLETCGPTKQEKFLELIRGEDPKWAEVILQKMLDMNRIYSWNQDVFAEIIGNLQDLTVAIILHGATEELRGRIMSCFTHLQQRKIDALFNEQKPTPVEISSAHVKIIESVRRMVQNGSLRFETFDAGLIVEPDIEETLAKESLPSEPALSPMPEPQKRHLSVVKPTIEAAKAESSKGQSVDPRVDEIHTLKKRVGELSKENANLRHELSMIKSKLDQIKRIA